MSEEPYRTCSSRTDVVSSDSGRGCLGDEEAQRGAAGAAGLPCPPAPPGQRPAQTGPPASAAAERGVRARRKIPETNEMLGGDKCRQGGHFL